MKFKDFILTTILIFSYSFNNSLWAVPTTVHQAEKVVLGWLQTDNRPLNVQIGQQITNVEVFAGENGEPIYYIVYMEPNGFVIVSADDFIEPIIGFVEKGTFDPSLGNPLGALVGGLILGIFEIFIAGYISSSLKDLFSMLLLLLVLYWRPQGLLGER